MGFRVRGCELDGVWGLGISGIVILVYIVVRKHVQCVLNSSVLGLLPNSNMEPYKGPYEDYKPL